MTPMMVQYGRHDALFKPMPEGRMTPSLAASYTESSDKLLKEKVKEIEIVDARRIRFQLKEPWLDFILSSRTRRRYMADWTASPLASRHLTRRHVLHGTLASAGLALGQQVFLYAGHSF